MIFAPLGEQPAENLGVGPLRRSQRQQLGLGPQQPVMADALSGW